MTKFEFHRHRKREHRKLTYFYAMNDYFFRNLSRRKVAEKWGVSQGTLSSWFSRKSCRDWFDEYFQQSHVNRVVNASRQIGMQ